MVPEISLMKQREISAHSSGCKSGDKRVFDAPAVGVLQIIATATVCIGICGDVISFRHDVSRLE
jgi:hypothetical protein